MWVVRPLNLWGLRWREAEKYGDHLHVWARAGAQRGNLEARVCDGSNRGEPGNDAVNDEGMCVGLSPWSMLAPGRGSAGALPDPRLSAPQRAMHRFLAA